MASVGRPNEHLLRPSSERDLPRPLVPKPIPEIWMPPISPDNTSTARSQTALARRGSTASIRSNGSAGVRPSIGEAIPERVDAEVEIVERDTRRTEYTPRALPRPIPDWRSWGLAPPIFRRDLQRDSGPGYEYEPDREFDSLETKDEPRKERRVDEETTRDLEVKKLEEKFARKLEEATRQKEEAVRQREEAMRQKEEATRQREEAVITALQAERKEEEFRKRGEEIKRKEEKVRRQEEEMKEREEEILRRAEEIRRKAEEVQMKERRAEKREQEEKKKEQEAKQKEQVVREKEKEAKEKEEELRKKHEEVRRRETEMRKHEDEVRKHEDKVRKCEEEVRKREEGAQQKELEARQKNEALDVCARLFILLQTPESFKELVCLQESQAQEMMDLLQKVRLTFWSYIHSSDMLI